MLSALATAALASAAGGALAQRGAELSLPGYEQPGGALSLRLDGQFVDPYFGGKALLAAREAGADPTKLARAWIEWLLPFQRRDGGFDRLCRRGDAYEPCAAADADDATLAIWIELLARFSPGRRLPPRWDSSFQRALQFLATLRDERSGLYRIAPESPVSLLMDNVEVDAALQALAERERRAGRPAAAGEWERRAEALRRAIRKTFEQSDGTFRVSTQEAPAAGFYPYEVAQIFPLSAGVVRPREAAARFDRWMALYRDHWLEQGRTDYPWALVALVAQRMGHREVVRCWRARAIPFRHGAHWNVLEEALLCAFEAQLSPEEALAPACGPG